MDVRLVQMNRRISDLEFSPDSSQLALAGRDAGVIFLDASSGERVSALPVNFEVTRITYLEGGDRVAVAGYSFEDRHPILEIWGVQDGQRKAELADHPTLDQICSLAVSPDGGILAAGYCDYNMMTWRTSPGFTSLGRVLGIHSWECYSHCGFPHNIVKFVPDSHTLVSATDNWEIPFRDIHSGRLVIVISTVRMIDEHSFSAWDAQDIAFNGDGSLFAIVAANELQIRDPNSGEFHHHLQIPVDDYFTHVAFGQSYVLALAKSEGTVQLWGVGR